ncbi:uncharacterized protein MYCGRDRAFT_95525 [Zymoseptoria tritici IPO323]|uniref:Amino acid transporter n=1 Tax=Zymoseptoria tritici (strain CBS 115943 / IPO323) TaxID=336722 RepID=F9XIZ3_ZYMTI|nr:uncharacterized protein MYCGRDRAFT_95525 [Zymoseptoria tritici IPO323]EGP84260.1 hypothetical protein MYCGRDRAFT_95525 [Zymoseptoria tritici IPO323]
MASPLLPLKPHLGSLDLESLSPTTSAASSLQPSRKRPSRAQPTTIDPDQRSGPIATRRQEIQRQYRLFWSTILAYTGQLFIVLSIAEMSSMVPLGGGQYRFVSAFAPPKFERMLSYITGWICSVGWQTRFTAHCYIIANMGQALIDLQARPTGTGTWFFHLTVIAVAILLSCFNAFAAGHLSIAEGVFAICHVFVLVPILASLWVLADKGDFHYIFFKLTDNGGGWPYTGLSACVGQLTSMFIMLGSDAMVYISEEVEEAEFIVPSSMVWSYVANLPMTFALLVTYIYNVGDLREVVRSPHPLVHVFETMLDSRNATIAFSVIVMGLLIMIAVSTMVATSRHLFSFGRDRALLFAPFISHVHPSLKVPLNAILLTLFTTSIISLCTMGTVSTLHTILGLSTSCFMASYSVSIGCLIRKRWIGEELPTCRWSLGRAGLWVNVLGWMYAVWALFWSFWPTRYAIQPSNANWAIVFFGWTVVAASALFLGAARRERMGRRGTMGRRGKSI